MPLLKNIDFKTGSILKITGLALGAIIIIALALRLIIPSFSALFPASGIKNIMMQSAPAFDTDEAYYKAGRGEMEIYSKGGTGGVTMGADAEEFEVTEYSAAIETRRLEDTCARVAALKARDDVVFESAGEYEKSCNYSFKVKQDSVAEILSIINELDPKELNENTYTIKRLIDDYAGETEILEKKMASIEETLANAVKAYDDITNLATRVQDVESLAKIIDSKINIIERLTQEKINVNAQLERLERAKAEQLDRLDYTYFNIYVLENKFVDGQNLKDSWKIAVKEFIRDINEVVQDITVGLAAMIFFALQYIIYFFIILVIVKYGWHWTKKIWDK
ncbi:hypothetical protein COT99_01400 [Candidatus Falkowbacteria bacterium CG10_big_fil_rev_8_21_14_0_10_43_10]|uniref:DUF4349 domain-containing protein n=1 Tax=Candidatus Falkowbacteria bacterium CG10_big_fil_rev_8_21_14_0_10_43_10 TaxID=1974567 RepID=A0A2H0V4F2_9BACT|nr:MAG: hypothetical protein COT99_01400 [Candidatus Falkowbacteria bacterium CG10_big_fil_rev_8_21_14_0_10_43_10]